MGKGPLAVFIAVLAVAGVAALSFLSSPREAIVSTPSAYTGLTKPLTVPPGGSACANEILFDPAMRIARFGGTVPPGQRAPDLEVTAQALPPGQKYRSDYRATATVKGGWSGERWLDVPLAPPAHETFGTFCVRNPSDRAIDLLGSEDGRAFARPEVQVNGAVSPLELQLRFLEAGRKSLLSRLGEVTAHAASAKPLGAWWMWVLAFALVGLAPLGVAAAVRSAFAADGTLTDDSPAPARLPWLSRASGWFARIPGWALVAAAGVVAVAWLFYWSVNTHVFQNDEDQYVYLSRWFWVGFPDSIWRFDVYGRGLQRLEIFLLALAGGITHAPASLALGRLLNVIAFVSTSIPVYLLARGLGLRPRWAALPAILSAVIPWAVVTTAFLTENLAYPAFAWVIYLTWRATNRPSAWADVLALASIFVAGLSRSALLALAPVLPLTVIATGLRCGTGTLKDRMIAVLREHVVLWAVIALAIVAVVPGMLGIGPTQGLSGKVAGGYGTPWNVNLWALVEKSGRYLSRVFIGTGFLPAAAGLPWLAVALVRSREPARFAFAVAALVSSLLMFYTLWTAGADERYIVYFAPLVLVAGAAALARRELTPLGLAIGSVLVALLVARVPWNGTQGEFGYFVWPVETFYGRTAGLRLDRLTPGGISAALVFAAVGLALVGLVLAWLLRRSPRAVHGPVTAGVIAAVFLAVLIQTDYSVSKHVEGVGSKSAPGLKARAFADVDTPGGATVGEFAAGIGMRPDFYGIWREVQFYNQRVETVFTTSPVPVVAPIGDTMVTDVGYDERTGRLSSPKPLTDYMVVPTQVDGPHLAGDVVAAPTYIPVALIKVAKPARVAWRTDGFADNGSVAVTGGADIRIYGSGCATLDLAAPVDRDVTYRVDDGPTRELAAQKTATATVPLRGPSTDVKLFGGAQLRNVHLGCA